LISALVLGQSIRQTKSSATLVVIVSPRFPKEHRDKLLLVWDKVIELPDVTPMNPDWNIEVSNYLFKYNAWLLEPYCKKFFWLGADTLVIKNIDHLLLWPAPAGVKDCWLDSWSTHPCVNGDLILAYPSKAQFDILMNKSRSMTLATLKWSEFGPWDQGVINYVYSDITMFPWYTCLQALSPWKWAAVSAAIDDLVNIFHFSGPDKPWTTWTHPRLREFDKKQLEYFYKMLYIYQQYVDLLLANNPSLIQYTMENCPTINGSLSRTRWPYPDIKFPVDEDPAKTYLSFGEIASDIDIP